MLTDDRRYKKKREKFPYWTTPISRLYYDTIVVPYQGRLMKKKNIQKHDVINDLMREYQHKTPVNRDGLELLYCRAESRGYLPKMIYIGLKTMICKNYDRKRYIPPNNDPMMEVIHERIYIEDWEFRNIFGG